MSNIFEEINKKQKMFKTKPVNEDAIKEAEIKLGRAFSDEYKNYLLQFGAISFSSTELTGLNIEKYANVVDVTLKEIEINEEFPKDCIVLENIGVEGILILINSKDQVFEWKNNSAIKIHENMAEYLRTKL
ncbi:MAG: SMI1/KNR4 family protein [Ignavibacterium sp.]|nr:SMI1/KNR4 family protein [Ignavibacterium sp.]